MDDDREQREKKIYVGFEKRERFLELQNAFLSLQPSSQDRLGNEQYAQVMGLSAVVGRFNV